MTRAELIEQSKKIISEILKKRRGKYDWTLNARAEQIPPVEWRNWLILAGRGFGKTRTGAETIRSMIADYGYRRICLLGETMHEVRRIMIEGKSGLLNIYPKHEVPRYYPSLNVIVWKNGAVAHGFSAENTEALRGPEFDLVWIDELAKFADPEECLNQVRMTMRIGQPRLIITTTPRPISIIKKLMEDEKVFVTRGSTLDNSKNLPQDFINSILEEYGDNKFGLQEIYGQIVDHDSKQLWDYSNLYHDNSKLPIDMEELVISVDPAVTCNQKSDETGIVVVGRLRNRFYVFEDCTIKATVLDWASIVVALSYKYDNSSVVIEVNQGGNLAKELILQIDPTIKIHEVRASKSKLIRAMPVAMMYNKGLVFHCTKFEELEKQLVDFTSLKHSPDRVDALIWGVTHLNHRKNGFKIV